MLSSRFKMPYEKIKQAIMALDTSVLTPESVENLLLYIPTSEEIEMIANFEEDRSKLGAAEQYFWVIKVCLFFLAAGNNTNSHQHY